MSDIAVVIIASFLLSFKAVLVEGSEVAIIAIATVSRLGKRNVLLGVALGALGSLVILLGVREVFVLLPDIVISLLTGSVLLYFSRKFLRGFLKYYSGRVNFSEKMKKEEDEIVRRDLAHGGDPQGVVPFSFTNSLPVLSITLTEGFEASLVLAAAGAFNLLWTAIGGGVSIVLLVVLSLLAYDHLVRVPHWFLDLLAGMVLLSFGSYFILTGALIWLGVWS